VPPYDVATCVEDLERLRPALGHDRWIVGGHSWGANLALAYTLAHPEQVRALLLLSDPGIQNDREWHAAYVRGGDEGRELLPEFAYPANVAVNRGCVRTWRAFIKQAALLRRIAALGVPALSVYGSEDIRPSWPAEQVADLMRKARFHRIEGAGHYLWLSHAEELRAVLRQFLGGLAAGGRSR
jgi:proline iminopeptidase